MHQPEDGRTIELRELILHPTHRCPLRCAHCFARSGPDAADELDEDAVLRCIDEAARLGTVERIGFSGGGDPFVRPRTLERAIGRAHRLGLRTTVVTSGFWASSLGNARRLLAPLAARGLDELTLSYDDAHARFVAEEKILAACRAGRELGLELKIAITREPNARITRETMVARLEEEGLGGEAVLVYETGVNSTGRALDESTPELRAERRRAELSYRGPCFSVLRQTSVTPDGSIIPCCGTAPPEALARLAIGRVPGDSVDQAVRSAADDPRLLWLATEGPVAILRQITADDPQPMDDGDFDGICQACAILHGDPRYLERMERALPSKLPSLLLQRQVLEILQAGPAGDQATASTAPAAAGGAP